MTIELSPDDAALAQQLIDSGEFESVEDLLHSALFILHREAIHSHIEEGIAQIERGETLTMDEVRASLAVERTAWLQANPAR